LCESQYAGMRSVYRVPNISFDETPNIKKI
jgi:hypothetical protein